MEFKKIIGTITPFIGSLIGGPFGAAATKIISKVLLDDDSGNEEEILEAISTASPEKLKELKKVDNEYKIRMAEIGITEKKIEQLDRSNARNREIKTGSVIPATLSIFLTAGFFGVLALLIFHPMKQEVSQIIDIMLGSLGTAWISCITYYFGSSSGSNLKTLLMSQGKHE